jgi:hypothetical protein
LDSILAKEARDGYLVFCKERRRRRCREPEAPEISRWLSAMRVLNIKAIDN